MTSQDLFPLFLSLKVACTATLFSALAGIPLAWLMARRKTWFTQALDSLATLPLVLPPSVLGYYLLVLIGKESALGKTIENLFGLSLVFTWQGAALAAMVVAFPLLVKSAKTAFEGVDPTLEEAARTLGRSEGAIWLTVTLPLAWRGITSGLILGFARGMGDFGATLMVAGNIPGKTQTMPLAIYDAVLSGETGRANWLVLVTTLAALVVLVAVNRLEYGARRKQNAPD